MCFLAMQKNIKTKYKGLTAERRRRYPTMYNFILNKVFEEDFEPSKATPESSAFWLDLFNITGYCNSSQFLSKIHAKEVLDHFFGYDIDEKTNKNKIK